MGKPEVQISRIVFIDLYVNQKKSGLEIARFFGIGRTTVSRYIKRYGLPPRTVSEVRKNKFWNGGESQKAAVRASTTKRMKERNPNYNGNFLELIGMTKQEYKNLHHWVKRELGSPHRCEGCGKTGLNGHQIGWANKTGKYLKQIDDWLRLCRKCHSAHDKNLTYN